MEQMYKGSDGGVKGVKQFLCWRQVLREADVEQVGRLLEGGGGRAGVSCIASVRQV